MDAGSQIDSAAQGAEMTAEALHRIERIEHDICAMRRHRTSWSARAWESASKLVVGFCILLAGWMTQLHDQVEHNKLSLEVVKETRFTGRDGANLERRLKEELPPRWLRDVVSELQEGQDQLRIDVLQRLARLEQRVENLKKD